MKHALEKPPVAAQSSIARRGAANAPASHYTQRPGTLGQLQQLIGNQALLRQREGQSQPGVTHIGGIGSESPHSRSQGTDRRADTPDVAMSSPGDAVERRADELARAVTTSTTSTSEAWMTPAAVLVHRFPPPVSVARDTSDQPLPVDYRHFMESRLHRSLNSVRLHADANAAESANALGARAYAIGHDIVFAAGEFAPGTIRGDQLLAHELAHVALQRDNPQVVYRQTATATQPATEKDRRRFVQDTIGFLQRSANFYGDPVVRIDAARFERVINNWYSMVETQERLIDTNLAGDVALKRDLRDAYTASIRTLITRAATALSKSEAELYRRNSGRIPMWAWPTPHRSEPGFSTPIPEASQVDIATGNVATESNGFSITLLPDMPSTTLKSGAETTISMS